MLLLVTTAIAADFYADPVSGSAAGDGSASDPWGTLEEVVAAGLFETSEWDAYPYVEGVSVLVPKTSGPIGPGDTLWLRSGYHGSVDLESAYNSGMITIAAEAGATPTLSHLTIRSASNWTVRGLTLSPSFAPAWDNQTMLDLDSHSWSGPVESIVVEDCELFSVDDSTAWDATDWNDLSATGIVADGTDITLRGNLLRNVNFGISVNATHSIVEGNTVENFAGDGLRGLGDYTTFQFNTVMNAYDVNDNHDDGFQSWSVGSDGSVGTGEVTGIVLRGNTIVNYVDPSQPLRGPLQGIGCFDGTFVDWVIEDNVIATDHWHGITLLGARGVSITNNTVVDLNEESPGPPWISIDDHKDGTPSEDCVVRNNLATDYVLGAGVLDDTNLTVTDPAEHFVAAPYDLHLVASSTAIDAGTSTGAPAADRDGKPRPLGAGIDVGAYEFGDPPEDTGTGSDTGAPAPMGTTPPTEGSPAEGGAVDEEIGGCGCAGSGAAPGWGLLWVALVAMRTRR